MEAAIWYLFVLVEQDFTWLKFMSTEMHAHMQIHAYVHGFH